MKLLLKLLLSLFILIAGIYSATPLWLPVIVTGLLPAGWQLDTLYAGYWGFSGININALGVRGEIQAAEIEVVASEIRFSYRGWKTEIGSLSLDVHFLAAEDRDADALTLDDLSLPIVKLTGKMPEFSVLKSRVVLHHDLSQLVNNPLVLSFQSLKLTPRADDSFHFVTDVSLEGSTGVNGRVDIDVNVNSLDSNIRFPASTGLPSWLEVVFEQRSQALDTTTQIRATFNAAAADQEWLDMVLARSTGGKLTHVSGTLKAQVDFAGNEQHVINQVSLTAEQLQVEFEGGSASIDAALLAGREVGKISVTLPKPAEIQFQDPNGKITELIMQAVPGLQRASGVVTMARAEIDTDSSLVIQTGDTPSMEFGGDVKLQMTSANSNFSLHATDLQFELEDISVPDKVSANGLVTLDWVENAPFSYVSDDLGLKADKLSLSSTGHFQLVDQNMDFEFDGPITASYLVINVPGDERAPPMTVTADEMSISAGLTSDNGKLVSTGSGTFIDGQVLPKVTSAAKTDITWQELDLLNMSGKLSTKTQGFVTEMEGETWTGFDFDITYTVLSTSDVKGSGIVMFDSGLEMPIVFTGNTQVEHWDVSLPASTIKLSQLGGLLRVAHFELPETVKLTEGYIDFQGDVVIRDEITAKMSVSGHEMGASMLESSAREASFTFDTTYGNTISAKGPLAVKTVALAGGIDVSHIRADLNLESEDTFDLNNLHAELMDGELNLGKLRFAENRIEDTTLEMTHISLARLLAFADIDGLEGTGFLNISLPAGSDEKGVYVRNGTFNSTAAGHLAYTKEGVAGSNIGLQALENFQYKDLSGTIDYQSDGVYQIAIRLEGNNPDLYGGHPVVFNLNISGSLPELFEAMFITGDFEEAILNEVRSR